jgi:hypothetical protein
MDTLNSLLAVGAGLLLRLAVPLLGTGILVYFLRKLDEQWQAEAELPRVRAAKIECWKIQGCSEGQKKSCKAAASSLPCWQFYRQPNGYLQENCISCEVFINAPIPALNIEPRRM